MSILKSDDNRVLAPAWYTSEEAIYSAELKALNKKKVITPEFSSLNSLYDLFNEHPSFDLALELFSVAFTENSLEIAKQAAKFIIESGKVLPTTLTSFCEKVLDDENKTTILDDNIKTQIKDKKNWLRKNPSDCLSWVDLSRLYMSIGQSKQAERAMIIGLGLSNDNRWVTRVSSRFFFHLEDYERSHSILLRHPNINHDPWLLASELAISNSYGRNSKFWLSAKKVLQIGYLPYHISELQSSIGTLELKSGALKKAKLLFSNSLVHPNGNVFAQAKWAERKGNIKNLVHHEDLIKHHKAFEAKYQEAYYNRNMPLALSYAKQWLDEEPFNPKPAIHASYVASLLDDYKQCRDISEKGLQINPSDETLKLNLIFSKISLEHLEHNGVSAESYSQAIDTVESVIKNDDDETYPHAYANLGLLYYKTGDLTKGRQFYEIATECFKKNNHPSFVLCELNHLREALISNSPWKEELFKSIEESLKLGGYWSEPCVSFYLEKLQKIRFTSKNWKVLLTENQSYRIESKPVVPLRGKFDFSNQSPTIWLPPGKK
ncbi:lipopolysaccharide assembly protein LapB [Enterobacter sp. CP102]|uniref:tetratricopeptide repeat protein n=1 Tax=Enterobacter sp. CP102 TaxID=2976431 RepID=UPI00220978BA|nr:hypothetical protein [Enterobacter sp. CP102]UWM62403.1 hypothetical protein N1249_12445 [Enterobacter sp. CP102]